MTRLEVFPPAARLKPGDEQPLVVRAHFSDGHAEDVTRWVKFSSNEGAVASVSDDGVVKVQGPGEAAISAWYLSQIVTARITSPFPNQIDPAVYARAPRANFIDELVLTKLAELNIEPSPLSSDTEFIRRAYLDAAGILPGAGRGPCVPGGHARRQARAPDRRAARASGVRRLLGVQVVRPAAGVEQEPALERHVVVLQLDPRERGGQQAVGPDGPRDPHRLRATRWRTARPITTCCTRTRSTSPKTSR